MTTIPVRNILDTDTRAAGWWHSADGQGHLDMRGATLAEARHDLLAQCGEERQREAILAGRIESVETYRIEVYDGARWVPAPGESSGWTLGEARRAVEAGIPAADGSENFDASDVRIVCEQTCDEVADAHEDDDTTDEGY